MLSDYLIACRRNRGPVLRRRRGPADDERPRARSCSTRPTRSRCSPRRARRSRRGGGIRWSSTCPAAGPRGCTAARRSAPDGVVGGVLDVQLISSVPRGGSRRAARAGRGAVRRRLGRGLAHVLPAVDRHLRAGEWLVLEGEPGSGPGDGGARRAPGADAGRRGCASCAAEEHGPPVARRGRRGARRRAAGRVVLTDVDRLPDEASWPSSPSVLEPLPRVDRRRPAVGGGHRGPLDGEPGRELAAAAGLLPAHGRRPAAAPPRRGPRPSWCRTCSPGSAAAPALTCSPEVMRVLMHNRWPGNVDQLVAVLRQIVAKRRSGVDRAARPAARVLGHRQAGAHPAGVAGVRRHRPGAAGHRRQQGRGGPPAGHVAGHDLPQGPRLRDRPARRPRARTARGEPDGHRRPARLPAGVAQPDSEPSSRWPSAR